MASCVAGSLGVSLIVLILIKMVPKCMVIFMTIMTILILVAIAVASLAIVQSRLSSFFFIITAIYVIFLCQNWDNMRKSAILMKTAGNFIVDNPKVLLVIGFALLYCFIILFFWIAGFYSFCTLYSHRQLSYGGFVMSLIFWIFMLIFWNFYFYYTSVFLTSSSLAIWFYDKTDIYDTVVTPFKLMVRYHLGSITFASLVITFGKIIKFLLIFANFRGCENPALQLIGCFVSCVIACCLGAI